VRGQRYRTGPEQSIEYAFAQCLQSAVLGFPSSTSSFPLTFSFLSHTHTSPLFLLIAAYCTSSNMAFSDTDYDIISPFNLPVQMGNDNDVPESSLNPRPAFNFNDFPGSSLPAFTFDDASSCVIVTNTPLADDDDEDLDDFEYSGFGSPGWLPVIKFANPGGVAANTITTAPTVRSGPHRPHGFDWSLPSPYEEEDTASSADATVVSSPELAASVYTPDGRSSSTTTTLSTASTLVERREIEISPLLPPRPFPDFVFSGAPGAISALRRPIAVGESAFTRGERTVWGARTQEESQAVATPFGWSSEQERSFIARSTMDQRAARSSRDSAAGDAMRITSRAAPPGQPVSVPTPWSVDHTSYPPHFHGRRRGAIW
jgi:hypothetical protein